MVALAVVVVMAVLVVWVIRLVLLHPKAAMVAAVQVLAQITAAVAAAVLLLPEQMERELLLAMVGQARPLLCLVLQ